MISHFSSSSEIFVSGYYSHISLTPLKKKQQEKGVKERGCASCRKFWFLQTCGNPLGKEDLGFLQILLPVLHNRQLLIIFQIRIEINRVSHFKKRPLCAALQTFSLLLGLGFYALFLQDTELYKYLHKHQQKTCSRTIER